MYSGTLTSKTANTLYLLVACVQFEDAWTKVRFPKQLIWSY